VDHNFPNDFHQLEDPQGISSLFSDGFGKD
jgi:hypothetical protein